MKTKIDKIIAESVKHTLKKMLNEGDINDVTNYLKDINSKHRLTPYTEKDRERNFSPNVLRDGKNLSFLKALGKAELWRIENGKPQMTDWSVEKCHKMAEIDLLDNKL